MKSDYIQIKDKFYQECDIIMLPVEKSHLFYHDCNRKFSYKIDEYNECRKSKCRHPQHLYIISSEEIKEGEDLIKGAWYVNTFREFGKPFQNDNLSNNGYLKNVIATTNESLDINIWQGNKSFIPRPSDDFLKAFVKAQGKIDKVLVEYVDWCDYDNEIGLDKPDLRLKVAPDNTITIKPIQEEKVSWNKEEIIQLIVNAIYYGIDTNGNLSDKWIEQNL